MCKICTFESGMRTVALAHVRERRKEEKQSSAIPPADMASDLDAQQSNS